MNIRSLGYRTDLLFIRFDGEVIDREEYLVCRTPSNPQFYWGNFILFAESVRSVELVDCKQIFTDEIGAPPTTNHIALGFDGTNGRFGQAEIFLQDGFRLDEILVFSTKRLNPPKPLQQVTIRPLRNQDEFDESVELSVVCRDPVHSESSYRTYSQKQMLRYQKLIESGMGEWFGAFFDDKLIGDLGIFAFDGLARYQNVKTHPDFRRRGVCSSLVYAAGTYAFETHTVDQLVICTEVCNRAANVYKSVGLVPTERQIGVTKYSS